MNNNIEDFRDLDITWGVKCYYGAFDSRTDAMHRKQDRALKRIREVMPDFSVTYFPAEGKYAVFNRHTPINMDWYATRGSALSAMIQQFVVCYL